MKKTNLLLSLFLAVPLLFSSCSKDDDSSTDTTVENNNNSSVSDTTEIVTTPTEPLNVSPNADLKDPSFALSSV